jgi:hypothetical protein
MATSAPLKRLQITIGFIALFQDTTRYNLVLKEKSFRCIRWRTTDFVAGVVASIKPNVFNRFL